MILERKAGRLLVKAYETRAEMGRAAAAEAAQALRAVLADKGSCRVIFAAAPSQNEFLEALCGADVDWSRVDKEDYLLAMERSPIKYVEIKVLLKAALTDKINDREVYMKGIDASYHYEGYNVYKTENIHDEPKKPPHQHDRDAR